jgi:hypothetical protein
LKLIHDNDKPNVFVSFFDCVCEDWVYKGKRKVVCYELLCMTPLITEEYLKSVKVKNCEGKVILISLEFKDVALSMQKVMP